jgi:hypothetical protein
MTGVAYAIQASRPGSEVLDGEPPPPGCDENRRAADEDGTRSAASVEPEPGPLRRWANTPIPCSRRPWPASFPD